VVPVPEQERDLGFKYLGWFAACVLVAVFLPLTGIVLTKLYETTIRAEHSIKEVDRLKKDVQKLLKELHDKNSREKLSI
jgi:hypothetical protein